MVAACNSGLCVMASIPVHGSLTDRCAADRERVHGTPVRACLYAASSCGLDVSAGALRCMRAHTRSHARTHDHTHACSLTRTLARSHARTLARSHARRYRLAQSCLAMASVSGHCEAHSVRGLPCMKATETVAHCCAAEHKTEQLRCAALPHAVRLVRCDRSSWCRRAQRYRRATSCSQSSRSKSSHRPPSRCAEQPRSAPPLLSLSLLFRRSPPPASVVHTRPWRHCRCRASFAALRVGSRTRPRHRWTATGRAFRRAKACRHRAGAKRVSRRTS